MSKARITELGARVSLCGANSIECMGQVFRPDKFTAFVEFYLSHAFPVVTCDGTGIHPQVVANSYRMMLHKVFDLNHMMKAYDPKENQDRILGTVVAVEFTGNAECGPDGKWRVQGEKSAAPGIRGVACMHRTAESVDGILARYFSGDIKWTVSMEDEYFVETSGFLVKPQTSNLKLQEFEEKTPEDLKALGWTYVPAEEAPIELLRCFDPDQSKVVSQWEGQEVVMLLGGLDGTVNYKGVGLTPLGKEKEAEVAQMLASQIKNPMQNADGQAEVFGALAGTLKLAGMLKAEG